MARIQPVVVLNLVGLTPELLGPHTPHLNRLAKKGGCLPVQAVTPAVTCSAQATYLTGCLPSEHGIVGNGWYKREDAEIAFWKQSNHLIRRPMIWDTVRAMAPGLKTAQLFWWYNMHSSADWAVTPRPQYPADGRKIPDIYTNPPGLRDELQSRLGTFPLFYFWGPNADIRSSHWIRDCALRVFDEKMPHLGFVYIPHLDYNLQRLGPDDPAIRKDVEMVDAIAGDFIDRLTPRGYRIIVLSEYGITRTDRPVHINRILRNEGLLVLREENGREYLDPGASPAFAVADHQIAHVYVADRNLIPRVRDLLRGVPGIERVCAGEERVALGLDHERSGDVIAISDERSWFTWYTFREGAEEKAPDYARTVDIHRKPGYDPVELFLDPKIRVPALKVGGKLLRKALGFRTLMDVIPLDATLVKGSHGRPTDRPEQGPLVMTSEGGLLPDADSIPAVKIHDLIVDHMTPPGSRRTTPSTRPAQQPPAAEAPGENPPGLLH